MNFNVNRVKIFVTVPTENAVEIRNAMCEAGAGVIGEYSYCSTSFKTLGTFIPGENSNPYIGEKNKLSLVEEEKIEMVCKVDKVKAVLTKLRELHPYEEPAIDIVPLIDEEYFR